MSENIFIVKKIFQSKDQAPQVKITLLQSNLILSTVPVLVRTAGVHVLIKHGVVHLGGVGGGGLAAGGGVARVVLREVGEVAGSLLVGGVALRLGVQVAALQPVAARVAGRLGEVRQLGLARVEADRQLLARHAVAGLHRQVALLVDPVDRSTLGFLLDGHLGGARLVLVFLLVVVQVGCCGERVSARFALVRFLPSVNTFVNFQIRLFGEVFATVRAFELLRYLVILANVALQISSARKFHTTE